MYLDNAATTRVLDIVEPIFKSYAFEKYYNPSGLYREAIEVSKDVRAAKKSLAKSLGVEDNTITWTSGGTESDNYAMLCCKKPRGGRIIVGDAEHAAVYQCAQALKAQGYDVVFCPVDGYGRVTVQALSALLTPDTCLVAVMHVNNNTGAINDLASLVLATKQCNRNALFFADGVQAAGHIKVNLRALGVDLYAIGGHKLGAPKGIGAMYVRNGVFVAPHILGGGQESGLRSGTENVIGAISMSACLDAYLANMSSLEAKGKELRECLLSFVASHPHCKMLSPQDGAPHICTIAFDNVRGEVFTHSLEDYGIQAGIGSACSSKKGTARIPKALGLTGGYEMGMVRFSINPFDSYDWIYLSECMQKAYDELCKYLRG